jgi:iron(III) transport system substrate-binding protein
MRPIALAIALACIPVAASAQTPLAESWMEPDLVAAAKAEGGLTVFASMNEQEALPLWKRFEQATGIPVAFVRASDGQLTSRILIEARAATSTWDLLATTTVTRLPAELRKIFEPKQAAQIFESARDPARRWYGVTANYNTPAYNTERIKAADLPKTLDDFVTRKEWRGHVAIDGQEFHWLRALVQQFGDEKGRKLARDFFANLDPTPIDGHLALARAIGSGDAWVTPANYMNLTINQTLAGSPTDYWGIDPVGLFYTQIALNPKGPHQKSAELAANFLLSKETQSFLTRQGRLPVRADVTPNPPDAVKRLGSAKIVPLEFTQEEERFWQKEFQSLIRPR